MTGNKYLIVHGHFYQPPRENPWLDAIEEQESAAPYHDWNERIYDECYRPNAYSRLLDSRGMITGIHNNYQDMSFNIGPTLFTWLERCHPVTARKIIAADKESAARFDGHGNAVAQNFNHIIMPLASRRDKLTQIRWAKYFFKKRYGRDPEGMWLGETAINMETVQCLIEENIGYVVLSPSQAEAFRPLHGGDWIQTNNTPLDTRRPYRILPRNRAGDLLEGHLNAFFFEERLSREVSFNDELLQESRTLGNRINECYNNNDGGNQLVTIATDGETFGHHKAYGDMCLAFFFTNIARELGITPVNFGYYLSINPPEYEVTLGDAFGEGRAWSCAHGVGRWSRDCGCSTGGKPGWHQAWRGPLRSALEKLQAQIDFHFEARLSTLFPDPWALRDKYINIMWEPSLAKTSDFLHSQSGGKFTFSDELTAEVRRLLEAQKFMLFAFTSCAWFFCDVSGIETIQNMAYACRALQLGLPEDSKQPVLDAFLDDLSKAPSNLNSDNGRTLFERLIMPYYHHERLLAFTAAAQHILAVKRQSSYEKTVYNLELKSVMSYRVERMHYDAVAVQMESGITGEASSWSVLICHSPDTELRGWVVPSKSVKAAGNKPEMWMSHPDARMFTLANLFYSSRQDLSGYFLDRMAKDTDSRFYGWMEQNEQNLNVLTRLNYPLPAYCRSPVGYVLQNRWNAQIQKLEKWGSEDGVVTELDGITNLASLYVAEVDKKQNALVLQNLIIKGLEMLQQKPSARVCDRLRHLLNIVDKFAVPVSKNKLEDIFFPVYDGALKDYYAKYVGGGGTDEDRELLVQLVSFARRMNFNTDVYTM